MIMSKPISGPVLKILREQRGLTQSELGGKAGISKDSISRLERGKQTGNAQRTRKALGGALGVAPEVLTGEADIPAPEDAPSNSRSDGRRHQLNIRVDGAVRNAFTLAFIRYRIPLARIVELAPFLFVVAAERSLKRRRAKLAELEAVFDQENALQSNFPHLPPSIAPSQFMARAAVAEEKASIARRDILAETLDERIFDDWDLARDDEAAEDNPFVSSLKETASDPHLAEITSFSRRDTNFEVCRGEAIELAGGNADLAACILAGWAPLHEMPRDLLKDDAVEERFAWLGEKAAEHKAAMVSLNDLL
jgi:transcriptional regulator with XRE-family HTH domain